MHITGNDIQRIAQEAAKTASERAERLLKSGSDLAENHQEQAALATLLSLNAGVSAMIAMAVNKMGS